MVKSLFGGNLLLSTMAQIQAHSQKQWVSKLFKPLDMLAIPGDSRQMPAKYEKWLPNFSGNDVVTVEEHMRNFWPFFQLNHVSYDAKYLMMKLLSATLQDVARRWYESLRVSSIKTMDQLEDFFLKRWSVKEDPNMLLMQLNEIKKSENETVREFHTKFERLLRQMPKSHHPG